MSPKFRARVAVLVAAASSLVLACSVGPSPVSRASNDPSNPSAAEGSSELRVATAEVTAAASPDTHDEHGGHGGHGGHADARHGDAGTAEVIYECPMHPEVTAKTPGLCPKCNMKLVPKK